ncbi:MAG: VWA domain-containing protein [Chthoniobacteraceae bacterium]|nr:VWA domain-containing protein [Chthoniobacteraceae bacterium]
MNPFADFGIALVHPWWLLLLLLVPVLAYLKGRKGGAPTVVFSSTEPLRALGGRAQSRAGQFLTGLLYLALALLIIALARPQKGTTLSSVEASGVDILLALDVSGSMKAEDFTIGGRPASRISVVKKVTEEFIARRPNDRIGIIAFAGRPYLVSPLTLDHQWLLQNMDRVQIGLVEDGTAIGSAIAMAANRLRGDKVAKSRVLILLTDGDNNAGRISPPTAAEAAKAVGARIYAIGAGSDGVARIPAGRNFMGMVQYQQVEPLNAEGLKEIARIGDGQFFRATDTRSLEAIYAQIDKLEKSTFEAKQYRQYRDLFPGFLGAGALLLLVQTVLGQTIWRRLP